MAQAQATIQPVASFKIYLVRVCYKHYTASAQDKDVCMATRLKIIWDGEVKGLNEHRLSVDAFGQTIVRLLPLLRRIASGIVTKALETERTLKGRYAEAARGIDIELAGIEQNCSGISAIVTYDPPFPFQPNLLGDLDARAAIEFCESVEWESKGVPKDSNVRDWLQALPAGIRYQKYSVEDESGGPLREPVEITDVHLAETPAMLPCLVRFSGQVIALGVEPGKSEIRLRKADGHTVSLSATNDQVLAAWNLRETRVRVLAVLTAERKLLTIEQDDAPEFVVTDGLVQEHVFQKWDEVLRRLAQ
jgi:hypothetical protein